MYSNVSTEKLHVIGRELARLLNTHTKDYDVWLRPPQATIDIFEARELSVLLNGRPEVNVDDLRANVYFTGGYDGSSQTVKFLWTVLTCLSPEQRSNVLAFITGSNRIPLDGFEPPLTITMEEEGVLSLPKSHTCFNQLVLPPCKCGKGVFS